MSMIFEYEEDKYIGFNDFLKLQESVEPRETDYGSYVDTGFKNKKWLHNKNSPHAHTFFTHKSGHHVVVTLNKDSGELAFSTRHSEIPSAHPAAYSAKRTDLKDSLMVFNKVAHVAIQGAKEHKLKHVRFNGNDERLDKTYTLITKNKFFLDKMKHHGFSYHGKDENNMHTFSKE
jgi:hypothetical protein